MIRLKKVVSIAKSTASTFAPNVDALLNHSNSKSKNQLLFPWRERPIVKQSVFQLVTFELWRKYKFVFGYSKTNNDGEIECGAGKAFAVSLEAIFNHRSIRNVLVKPQTENKQCNMNRLNNSSDVPLLSDVFERKLEEFYEHAILKFSLNNLHEIGYSLVAMNSPKIVKREIIVGMRRETCSNLVEKPYYWRTPFGISFLLDRTIFSTEMSFVEAARRSWLSGELTVRYWVDMECTEIFFIKDKHSGVVTQGSINEEVVVHQILLESFMRYELRRDTCTLQRMGSNNNISGGGDASSDGDMEWSVVDVDFWMEDSLFWAASKTGEEPHDED